MPTSSGPNTSGENSLAFAYDVADIRNSYIGEPTTNLLPTPSINAIPKIGNSWGTYNTNQYNGGNYFSIGTISSVSSNIVTTAGTHPLRTYDAVMPQSSGGGLTGGTTYFVKKISNTQFSLHAYNSSQDGSQGYVNTSTGYPVVWDSIALDQRVSINASSFPTMWWGYPHLPNSGLVKEIRSNGFKNPTTGIITDCIRLNWIRPDGVTDGMAYEVNASITPNQIVCCSFWMKAVSASAVGQVVQFYHYTYGVTSPTDYYINATIGPLGEWRRYSYTFNSPNNTAISYWFPSTGNMVVDIANIQIEQKTHATPFIAGTRSISGSLLDLTRNNTVTLNTSYDASAQIVFDGTDDYINASTTLGANCTLELVIQSSNYNVKIPISLDGNNYSSGPNIFFYNNVISWNTGDSADNPFSNSSYPNSNYHHIVVSNTSGVNAILYIDGVQIGTAGSLNATTTGANKLWIGRFHGDNNYTIAGNIPIVKVYNRALTANEVLQNYNAYKSRFNIT